MNTRRAVWGFLLSFVFLSFFAYIIFSMQGIFGHFFQNQGKVIFLGSVSNVLQNNTSETVTENTVLVSSRPGIVAKSAISVESNLQQPGRSSDKVLFEKDSDTPLPIASLTKLMTAAIVLDNYNLSDTAVVDKIADSQDPMKQDVKLGEVMTVENFLDIMLVGSSNKSAYVLSEGTGEQKFVALMNQKSKEIGLQNTFFVDPTGLSPQDISTARDLTKLAEYILKNYPKVADISKEKEIYVPGFGNVENTDQLLGEIPDTICSKTGFTTEARGCLLLVVNNSKNNDHLINVILGSDNRFQDTRNLIDLSGSKCK